jgi:hypothetical protein
VKLESTRIIDIEKFVPRASIDRLYWDTPYHLPPAGKTGIEAYAVIRAAMAKQNMVAIGRLVMSTRERICGIEIEEGGLVLTTLRTAEEVALAIGSPHAAVVRWSTPGATKMDDPPDQLVPIRPAAGRPTRRRLAQPRACTARSWVAIPATIQTSSHSADRAPGRAVRDRIRSWAEMVTWQSPRGLENRLPAMPTERSGPARGLTPCRT